MAQTLTAVGWSLRSLQLQDFFHSARSLTTVTAAIPTATNAQQLSFLPLPPSRRCVHFKSRGLQRPVISTEPDVDAGGMISDSEGDGESKKSRNEKKREARRAVRWGMELASFSAPQIKRIVRVASLEQEVFDALMLAKKLGTDVREGKRRQINYIGTRYMFGKLLRDAEPELLGSLIQATKDGGYRVIETLAAIKWDEDEDISESETEQENEEEELTAMPWNEIPPNSLRRKQNSLFSGGFSLGVDLGLSRTGLAISKGFSVRPLKVLELRGQKLEHMLLNIAEQREVDEFIIGLPTSSDGKETPQSNKVRSVAGRIAALAAERGWRVYLQGEYGTSLDAMQMMIDRGLSKSSRQENLDSYAAMVVLERYFSSSGQDTELVWPKKLEIQEKLRSAAKGQLEDLD